jgi:hypothetical protein
MELLLLLLAFVLLRSTRPEYVPELEHQAYLVPTIKESNAHCSLEHCCERENVLLDVAKRDKSFLSKIQPSQRGIWHERDSRLIKRLTSCYCALRHRIPSRFPPPRDKKKFSPPEGLDEASLRILARTGYSIADMINDISRVPLRGCVSRIHAETAIRSRGVEFFDELVASISEEKEVDEEEDVVVGMIEGILEETSMEIKEEARKMRERRQGVRNFRSKHIALSASEQIAVGYKKIGDAKSITRDIVHSIQNNPITLGFTASSRKLSYFEQDGQMKQIWQVHDFSKDIDADETDYIYTAHRDDTERYFFGYEGRNGEDSTCKKKEPFPNTIFQRPISASISLSSQKPLLRDAAAGHFGSSFLVLKREEISKRSTLVGQDTMVRFDQLFKYSPKRKGCESVVSKFPPKGGGKDQIGTFAYVWPAIMSMDRKYIKNVFVKRDSQRLFDSYLEVNFVNLRLDTDVESYHLAFQELSDGLNTVSELKSVLRRWKALAGDERPVFVILGNLKKNVDELLTSLDDLHDDDMRLQDAIRAILLSWRI